MVEKSFYYIVGRRSCPYCVKAKELLQERDRNCTFRDLEKERELLTEYTKKYNWNTVPMVFYFDSNHKPQFLGGYSDLIKHLDNTG